MPADDASPHSVRALTARASVDQLAVIGQSMTLDATGSTSHAVDSQLDYAWELRAPTGSGATLSDPRAPRPSFVVDLLGDYIATLTVTDGTGTAITSVRVSTGNVAPVAHINPDLSFGLGEVVTLDGRASSDANGDTLSFAWTLLKAPAGSTARLASDDTPTPYFIADVAGHYLVELRTHDGRQQGDAVRQWFSTVNTAAVADAGKARIIAPGQSVRLNGAATIDPQRDALDYRWRVLHAPTDDLYHLDDANTPTAVFSARVPGDYVLQLAVRDGSDLPASLATTVVSVVERTALPTTPLARGGLDTDGDGVPDDVDNCVNDFNPTQLDTNGDGFGNRCDPDLDNDGFITNFGDLGLLRLAFFSVPGAPNWNPDADFNEDNTVNFIDLGIMRTFFFGPPGPLALTFINPNGGSWHEPANWSPPVIPNTTHTVRIDLAPGNVVEYSTGTSEIAGLVATSPVSISGGSLSIAGDAQFNAGLTLDDATLANANVLPPTDPAIAQLQAIGNATLDSVDLGMDLIVANGVNVNIEEGMTLNGSAIVLTSDGSFATVLFAGPNGATSTLDGDGEVRFAGTTSSSTVNEVRVGASHNLIIGESITVRSDTTGGRVRSVTNDSAITFEGTAISNVTGRRVIMTGAPLIIRGTITATNDSTFTADSTSAGSLIAPQALIDATDSEIELFGLFDHQGLTTLNNSTLDIGNNATENWTNTGSIDAINSSIELGGRFTAADVGTFTGSGTMLIDGTLDNSGVALDLGTLFSDAVEFGGNGTLLGGSLITTPVSVVSAFTFDAVTLGVDMALASGAALILRNDFTLNNATVTLNSNGNFTILSFTGAAQETSVFGGTGTVRYAGTTPSSAVNEIRVSSASHALVIDSGISIETDTAGGRIRGISNNSPITFNGSLISNVSGRDVTIAGAPLIVNGTFDVSNGGRIIADFLTAASLISSSAVLTATGGELELVGTFTNEGTINVTDGTLDIGDNATESWSNAGTININNATVELGGRFTVADAGTFTGSGTLLLNGTLDNVGGSVDLGALFSGSLTLGGSGTVLGGTIINSPFTVSSNFTFDGVTLAADTTIANGTNLTIVNNLILDEATVRLQSIGSFTVLSFSGPNGGTSTLGGTGEVRFGGTTNSSTVNEIRAASANNALVIGSGITLISDTAGGRVRNILGNTAVTLNGAVESSLANRTVLIQGAPLVVNGTLMAATGGKVTADFVTAGVIGSAATVSASGADSEIELLGFVTNNADINIVDGTLDIGNNTNEDWTNNATINLSNATAELGGVFTTTDIGTLTGTGTLLIDGVLDNTGQSLDVNALFGGTVALGGNGTLLGGALVTTPVTVVSGFSLDGVTLGADLIINSASTVTVRNSLTLNNANVLLNSAGNFTTLLFAGDSGATSTLGGTGEVRFGGTTTSSSVAEIRNSSANHTLLIDSGITVRTAAAGGRIRATGSSASMIVNGSVIADVSGRSITLIATAPLTVGGTLSASNGATIAADFGAGSSITNAATLNANGGQLNLLGLFSTAGIIDITDGTLDIGNSNTEAWSNTGTITLNNSIIELGGAIVPANIGTINGSGTMLIDGDIDNTGQSLDLGTLFAGSITLGGNGAITGGSLVGTSATVVSQFDFNDGVTAGTDLTVANNGRLDIRGGLTLNNADISLASSGNFTYVNFLGSNGESVTLGGTGEVRFAGSATGSTVNEIRTTGGINLTIDGGITLRTVTTGGRVRNVSGGGAITVDGAVVSDVAGRTVTLSSTALLIQGTVDTRAGAVTALGSFTLGSSAVLNAQIGGPALASLGRYTGTAATLSGTLNVALANGYAPLLGESYPLIAYASASGTFATINVPALGGGLTLTPVYNANNLSLDVTN